MPEPLAPTETRVAGAIADFNAQQVPEELKNVTVNLEDIGKALSSNEPTGSTITSGGKEVTQVVPDAKKSDEVKVETVKPDKKKEEKKVEDKKPDEKKVSPILKAPVEEKKEEVKLDDKKEEVKTTPLIKPITPVKEEKGQEDKFDYNGYAAQEVTNMKNMSRQSREAYAELIKQNRELSKLKDGIYLQHEGAYTLSPEYGELQKKGFLATNESSAWERALLDIKAGKAFRPPVGIDKNGQIVLGEEMQPTDALEIQVSGNLQRCQQVLGQVDSDLRMFPNRYKQQVGTDLQAVKETQRSMFAWHQDPKLLDYKIDIEGRGELTLAQIKQDMKSMWPVYMQNHPAVDVLGDMMISLRIRDGELREARKGQKVAEIEREDVKRGEPSSSSLPDVATNKKQAKNGMPQTFEAPPAGLGL